MEYSGYTTHEISKGKRTRRRKTEVETFRTANPSLVAFHSCKDYTVEGALSLLFPLHTGAKSHFLSINLNRCEFFEKKMNCVKNMNVV